MFIIKSRYYLTINNHKKLKNGQNNLFRLINANLHLNLCFLGYLGYQDDQEDHQHQEYQPILVYQVDQCFQEVPLHLVDRLYLVVQQHLVVRVVQALPEAQGYLSFLEDQEHLLVLVVQEYQLVL